MERSELVKISINELKSNKLKTALTMLGIVFGVASVVAMMSIGEGARQETLDQIELLGTNNIIVTRQDVTAENKTTQTFSPGLTLKDAVAIEKINPYVKSIVAQKETEARVVYGSNIIDAQIIGVTQNYADVFNSKLSVGSFFNDYHIESYSNVCVIGHDIKTKLFKYSDAVGRRIKINDQWFKIAGVMEYKKSSGGSFAGMRNFNEDIYVPITTMFYKVKQAPDNSRRRWRSNQANYIDRSSIDQITIKVLNDNQIVEASFLTNKILSRKHYGVKDFKVVIPEQIIEQKQKTQRIFNVVMGAIAGISLLVGGIGIMNIMLANIMERTKEIGIRRAIGATRRNVLEQFMLEAFIISVVGGILGIIIGFILTSMITSYAEWRTIITPYSVILAFAVSVAVGLGFGSYPAKKAAEKDPIESLRYE